MDFQCPCKFLPGFTFKIAPVVHSKTPRNTVSHNLLKHHSKESNMNSTLKVLASLSILMLTWSSNASAFASAESLSLCEQNSGDFPHNMDGFKRLSGQWSIGKDCI